MYKRQLEELQEGTPDQRALLAEVDVLVDGRFELARRDLTLAFRGSTNQRVLDARASVAAGHAVPWPPARAATSFPVDDRPQMLRRL